jgi:plastocyanin
MPGNHDMGDMAGSGESTTVEITNFAFAPAELTVAAGTEVTFTNLDSAPHTVTAGTDDDPMTDLFDSGLLQQGESFTFAFDEPGTYAYFCDRHPPMQASITVEN